ncbi:hypothetical protein [Streptomyces carpaticus]|uniref:PucR family transcriptional regulator n=1 Tax=Streptomyces carpaticus TaxID=285558 RepID=A0ABV4ZMP1_9ACTN
MAEALPAALAADSGGDGVARAVRETATGVLRRALHTLLTDEDTHDTVRAALRPHAGGAPEGPEAVPVPAPWIPPGAPL